jgi:hypothetical protein
LLSTRPPFVDQRGDAPVYSPNDLPVLRTLGMCMSLPEPEETADERALRRDVA